MDNLIDPQSDTLGRLPHLGVLRFSGPDTVSFLQGQLSNDIRQLGGAVPLLAAYSTPQGRVFAVLKLLPHADGVIAILPRELVMPTLERLRRYLLRAKVAMEDWSGQFLVAGAFGAAALTCRALPVPGVAGGCVEHRGIGIARVGAQDHRYWVVGGAADLSSLGLPPAGDAASDIEAAWRLADIRRGLPQVYAATHEMFVAQMLNLDLLDGISFTKGCFTGQEIIARTQHLGRIKRRLFRLRLPPGHWAVGQAVQLRDGRGGRLTEVARAGMDFEALAVLPVEVGGAGERSEAGGGDAGSKAGGGAGSDAGALPANAGMLIDASELPLPYALRGLVN